MLPFCRFIHSNLATLATWFRSLDCTLILISCSRFATTVALLQLLYGKPPWRRALTPTSCLDAPVCLRKDRRRSENNTILCNACGLFLKLHNRARPISLKTDVIKSRNRIRTSGQGQQPKKKVSIGSSSSPHTLTLAQSSLDTVQSGLAAAHPELSYSSQLPQHNLGSYRRASQHFPGSDGIISRSSTPSTYPPHPSHTSNIAPQHLFDGVSIEGSPHHPYSSTHSPSFTHGSLHPSNLSAPPRNNSPSSSSLLNGATSHHVSETYDSLAHQNDKLKTRVSELEVINDLFRGRVAELERNEAEATRNLDDALRRLHQASSRLEEIERRETELGCNGDHQDSERSTKRLRMSMSDLIEDEGREDVETEAVVRANGTSGE